MLLPVRGVHAGHFNALTLRGVDEFLIPQIDTHVPCPHTDFEENKIAWLEMQPADRLATIGKLRGRTGQADAEFFTEGEIGKAAGVNAFLAHAAITMGYTLPFIIAVEQTGNCSL